MLPNLTFVDVVDLFQKLFRASPDTRPVYFPTEHLSLEQQTHSLFPAAILSRPQLVDPPQDVFNFFQLQGGPHLASNAWYPECMSHKHRIENDVLDAVREDELASIIAQLRERDKASDEEV